VTPAIDVTAADPLDAQLAPAARAVRPARWRRMHRAALGFSATRVPVFVLVGAGVLLGPHGIAILTPPMLDGVQPVMAVVLGALGVLIGIGFDVRSGRDLRLLAAGSLESAVTIAAIAGAVVLAAPPAAAANAPLLALALVIGACGGSSSSHPATFSQSAVSARVTRLTDLDDLIPIGAATIVLALVGAAPRDAGLLLFKAAAAGVALAFAGRLLVGETESHGEQRVFVIAMLLLIAGSAEYLRVPSLFVGLIAGLVWGATDRAGDRLASNVRYFQHPILVMLLAVAGARLVPSLLAAWLAAVFVLARIAGKVIGGWIASAAVDRQLPRLVALRTLSPGLVVIALALAAEQVIGGTAGQLLLAAVVAGAAASDLLSLAVNPEEQA
jgi:hypothetical protein